MQHLGIEVNCRHSLNAQPVHLVLKQGSINHFMLNGRIVQGKKVERLHHFGAIGAGERHIGGELDWAFDAFDALCYHLVGQVFALPIGIEHCQQERGELMPTRNAPEAYACGLPLFEQDELEFVLIALLYKGREFVTGAGKVVDKVEHLLAVRKTMVDGGLKCEIGF